MTTRKHNEFLDAPSDDDEASARGYDSEENVVESKGRAAKKRRTDTQDFFGLEPDEELSADEDDEEEELLRAKVKGRGSKQSKPTKRGSGLEEDKDDEDAQEDEGEDQDGDTHLESESESKEKEKPTKVLSTKSLKKPKKDKSGVVYLSSLPPYLKP